MLIQRTSFSPEEATVMCLVGTLAPLEGYGRPLPAGEESKCTPDNATQPEMNTQQKIEIMMYTSRLSSSHKFKRTHAPLSHLAILVDIGVPHVAFEGHGRRRVRKVGRKV